jgi:hypothetical protein
VTNDLLQIFLTTLHFVAANLAVGGPVVALWLDRRSGRGDAEADLSGRRLLRASLLGLYAAILLGVFVGYLWLRSAPVGVERAFRALPFSRYGYGVLELIFSAVCWEVWLRLWSKNVRRRLGWWLGFAGATNVVYHFPTLFAVLVVLSERSIAAGTTVRFVSMLADPEVLARTFHFITASLAVTGAFAVQMLVRRQQATPDNEGLERLKRRNAQIALFATVLQWPIGIGVLVALPEASRSGLLGDDPAATGLFGMSLGGVIVLMHHLAAASFGRSTLREARSILLWLGAVVVLMTAVRHYARKPLYPQPPIEIMRQAETEAKPFFVLGSSCLVRPA